MSYKALVDSQARKAFILLKDLATDGVFTLKSGVAFNFSTAATSANTGEPVTVKVIAVETLKTPKDTNLIKKVIMFRSKDLEDITSYARLSFEGFDWTFGESLKNDGTVWIATIQREG